MLTGKRERESWRKCWRNGEARQELAESGGADDYQFEKMIEFVEKISRLSRRMKAQRKQRKE